MLYPYLFSISSDAQAFSGLNEIQQRTNRVNEDVCSVLIFHLVLQLPLKAMVLLANSMEI
jgi:hypothetical protein